MNKIKTEINYSGVVKKLIQQRRSVGLLQFEVKEENNFAKWYSLTENLVIKVFGPKSNQLDQLQDLFHDMRSSSDYETVFGKKMESREAKNKLKNLLNVFIEELKMDMDEKQSVQVRSGTKNVLVSKQIINSNISIQQIIENIREIEPDDKRVAEAETKLKELEEELKQKNPTWAKIKSVLEWLLNFGRDAFIAVLPIILERYKK